MLEFRELFASGAGNTSCRRGALILAWFLRIQKRQRESRREREREREREGEGERETVEWSWEACLLGK
jgi:hypothetical protein